MQIELTKEELSLLILNNAMSVLLMEKLGRGLDKQPKEHSDTLVLQKKMVVLAKENGFDAIAVGDTLGYNHDHFLNEMKEIETDLIMNKLSKVLGSFGLEDEIEEASNHSALGKAHVTMMTPAEFFSKLKGKGIEPPAGISGTDNPAFEDILAKLNNENNSVPKNQTGDAISDDIDNFFNKNERN